MKWYAFLTNNSSSNVNLILDHNTTAKVAWTSNANTTTPDIINSQLTTDIENWNDTIKSTARLITANEINQIAPNVDDGGWILTNGNTWYWLHTGSKSGGYTGTAGTNKYGWLFDNMENCSGFGCNNNQTGTNGYWTSTAPHAGWAWNVHLDGAMDCCTSTNATNYGVRPVITVSKNIFG